MRAAELNSNRFCGLRRAHDEGNDGHGTAAHGAPGTGRSGSTSFQRKVAPVVGRACAFFGLEQMKVRPRHAPRHRDRRKLRKSSGIRDAVVNEGTGVDQFLQVRRSYSPGATTVDVWAGSARCNLASPIQQPGGQGALCSSFECLAERVRVEVSAIDIFPSPVARHYVDPG